MEPTIFGVPVTEAIILGVIAQIGLALAHGLAYWRDRGKQEIDRRKVATEIKSSDHDDSIKTQAAITKQFQAVMEQMRVSNELLQKEVNRLHRRIDTLTQHIDVLRAALIERGVVPPSMPPASGG